MLSYERNDGDCCYMRMNNRDMFQLSTNLLTATNEVLSAHIQYICNNTSLHFKTKSTKPQNLDVLFKISRLEGLIMCKGYRHPQLSVLVFRLAVLSLKKD